MAVLLIYCPCMAMTARRHIKAAPKHLGRPGLHHRVRGHRRDGAVGSLGAGGRQIPPITVWCSTFSSPYMGSACSAGFTAAEPGAQAASEKLLRYLR
jgi:RNA 3'-terminal phosphate cyclase